MERIVSIITNNSQQIQEECEVIQRLLTTILNKDKEAVKYLTEKDITLNKKHLFDLLDYQHLVLKKLSEIDIELDEFTKDGDTSNLELMSCKSELSLATPSTYVCDIPCKRSVSPEEPCKLSNTPIPEESLVSKRKCELSLVTLPVYSYETCTSNKESTSSEESKQPTARHSPVNALLIEKPKETVKESSSKETAKESSSESSTESVNDKRDKSSADISSSEEVCKKDEEKSTQEKLKCRKLMTRRDRHLQNLERPDVPDLAFRPSTRTFENGVNYMTCLESSSSTSVGKFQEKRKRKKRPSEREVNGASSAISYKNAPVPYVNMSCLISRIVSPSEFYINHFDENIGIIDTISQQLEEIYGQTQTPFLDKKHAMEVLGNTCVCYLPNFDSWYRVTVTNWRLNARDYQEDEVTVYLVDYGHVCNTTYKNLRELSEVFCQVPKCAIKCHLAWLYPPGSTKNNLLETWPKKTMEFFSGLLAESADKIFKVIYVEKCGRSWAVDIINDDDKNETPTYGQLLLDNEMAVEIFQDASALFKNEFFRKQVATAQGLAGITPEMDAGEKIDKFIENTGDKEYSNLEQAMLEYRARDEARICKHTRPDGTCFKGKRCKLDHGKLRKDGYTTDKQVIYVSAFNELELPTVNTTVKLQITNVISVNTFYACLDENSEGLRSLIKKMNRPSIVNQYKPLDIIPARGELVIAKSWNERWYRGQVKDFYHFPQNPEETVQVFLVDLGETIDTNMSNIRIIDKEFLYLPFQAVFCKLYNVKPKEDVDADEAKAYCEEHFLCQIFNAEIQYSRPSTLEVLLKKQTNNEDVGEQIIEEGFGELRTDHIYPAEILLVD